MYQMPLPSHIKNLTPQASVDLINQHRKELGNNLVFLGHHYQRDDVIQFADFQGDSLKLSQLAAQQTEAKYIVFCGVHFMAESADILTSDDQAVFLPDMTAGCSMADMADLDQVEMAWEDLSQHFPNMSKVIPVTYVNSSAEIKAFTGRNNGICVTSSNCRFIFESVWENDPEATILFLPDEHLGRNTAYEMGVPLDQMPLYDPFAEMGGITDEQYKNSKVILWKGFCSVHAEFNVEQIQEAREKDPDVNVIVHPECGFDVVQAADASGSTAKIVQLIENAEEGSKWVVGTEINLVKRLAQRLEDKHIQVRSLSGKACPCVTMYRIDLPHLTWIIDNIAKHFKDPENTKLYNQIRVPDEIKEQARLSLDRMMMITQAATSAT